MERRGPPPSNDLSQSAERLRQEVEALRVNTGSQAAYLLNASGQLLLEVGSAREVDATILGMLVAGGMATTLEMAQMLHEPQISSLHFYRGRRHEIYASALDRTHLVCLVLEKYSQQSQIGIVWLYMKRSLARIRHLLLELERCRGAEPVLRSDELEQAILDVWDGGGTEEKPSDPGPEDSPGEARPLYSYDEATQLGIFTESKRAKKD